MRECVNVRMRVGLTAAHHGANSCVNSRLKGRVVDFHLRALVHNRDVAGAVGLLRIIDPMFRIGNHPLGLHAAATTNRQKDRKTGSKIAGLSLARAPAESLFSVCFSISIHR
jgi:hypothetical protein